MMLRAGPAVRCMRIQLMGCSAIRKEENVKEVSDGFLIEEIKKRLAERKKTLNDFADANRELEIVNEKLRQSESLKSNFLSNIRNEINNPLTVILGMSRQLSKGIPDEKSARTAAELIYKEAFELEFKMVNIFTAAEIEAGEASVNVSHTDINGLIWSLMDSFHHQATDKKIAVECSVEAPKPGAVLFFNTDPEKLSCILSNLLSNAIEYGQEGGRVQVFAKKDGPLLRLSVLDTGIGIEEKDRDRIFDRFTQLDTGAMRKHKGQGLGLSIVKALTDMLGGDVTVSSSPGKGCNFTLTLNELGTGDEIRDLSEDGNERIFDGAQQY